MDKRVKMIIIFIIFFILMKFLDIITDGLFIYGDIEKELEIVKVENSTVFGDEKFKYHSKHSNADKYIVFLNDSQTNIEYKSFVSRSMYNKIRENGINKKVKVVINKNSPNVNNNIYVILGDKENIFRSIIYIE